MIKFNTAGNIVAVDKAGNDLTLCPYDWKILSLNDSCVDNTSDVISVDSSDPAFVNLDRNDDHDCCGICTVAILPNNVVFKDSWFEAPDFSNIVKAISKVEFTWKDEQDV